MTDPTDDLLYVNGLDARTGDYLVPPLRPDQLAALARGERFDPTDLAELVWRGRKEATFGVKEGVDPTDLAQAGWGAIFAADADPAIREALGELLEHRRRGAEAQAPRFRVFEGPTGYRPGESKSDFLARLGVGPGPVDPDKVPFYLLIVGDPETIPYAFGAQLDVAYAVGREIHFGTVDEYARYARSVVEAETTSPPRSRRAAFFGVRNEGDGATTLSSMQLVAPLADGIAADRPDWTIDQIPASDATKSRLRGLLGGAETPALLFTASHGIGFPIGDPLQLSDQGALVCADWPGPAARAPVTPDWYLAGADVADDARLGGLIAFHFACFGAGTPHLDDYAHVAQGARERTAIAPGSFIAALPQRLLGHPNGGALAVIGHVERAWGSSFVWDRAGAQVTVFRSTLDRLMDGQPVGHAVDYLNLRYAELATMLSSELEDIKYGKQVDPLGLSMLWTAANDARGYAVIGDPAVRLSAGGGADGPPGGSAEAAASAAVSGAKSAASTPSGGPATSAPWATRTVPGEAPVPVSTWAPAPSVRPTILPGQVLGPPGSEPISYLFGDSLRDAGKQLGDALAGFADRLARTLTAMVDDASTLEVETYVSDNLEAVVYDGHRFTGSARLRALTRVGLDGDTLACVPEADGIVDVDLWRIHMELVAQAQAGRAALIGVAASAAGSLLGVLK